jgi:lactoylglutathione lyase
MLSSCYSSMLRAVVILGLVAGYSEKGAVAAWVPRSSLRSWRIPSGVVATHLQMTTSNAPTLTAGISHVGLSVSNLNGSLKFFEAIGFNKVGGRESYPSYFISDGSSLVTLWQTDNGATPFDRRKNVGLHHLAIKVSSLQALDEAYAAVQTVPGVRVDGEGAFGPEKLNGTTLTHAMVFEPSGNRIELTFHSE